MIRIVETIETNDAGWVQFAILTLPGHIASLKWFGAYTQSQVIIPNALNHALWLLTVK